MPNQHTLRMVVSPSGASKTTDQPTQVDLVFPDGTAVAPVKKQAAQADTVAADLAALKVDFNALLLKLKNAGILS